MRRFSIIIAVAAGFTSTASAAPYGERQCYVDGFETPVRCLSVTVPLDYAAPKGETITISVAIAPATTARPKPDPLFVFAAMGYGGNCSLPMIFGTKLTTIRPFR